MADNRARIQKDLEKSIIAGSIVTTDLNNEQQYTPPTTVGDVLVVGASGLPVWETPLDPARPWNKTGDLQATNNEGILTTDNILHEGRVNIGASEAETPFDLEYVQKIGDDALGIANTRTYGYTVSRDDFKMNQTRRQSFDANQQFCYLDVINGVDALEPASYLGATNLGAPVPATSTTPASGYKFKTWRAAVDWINQWQGKSTGLIIQGTTLAAPLIIDGSFGFYDKVTVLFQSGDAGLKQYVTISGSGNIQSWNSNVTFGNVVLTINNNFALNAVTNGSFTFSNGTDIIIGALCTTGALKANSNFGTYKFNNNVTLTFSANNQILFNTDSNSAICNVIFSNGIVAFTLNDGGFTGILWAAGNTNVNTYIMSSLTTLIPASINMINTAIYYGGNITINQTTFNLADGLANSLQLGAVLPLRFLDVNSTTVDMTGTSFSDIQINELGQVGKLASVWTTATRPATPIGGRDGFNSTLGQKEYWDGVFWVQY